MSSVGVIDDLEMVRIVKERKEREAAYANITEQEFAAVCFAVENFCGKEQDPKALARYQHVKETAKLLCAGSADVVAWSELPPDPSRRHALVFLDVCPILYFSNRPFHVLQKAIQLSDSVCIAQVPQTGGLRITFSVCNVWRA